MTKIAVKSLICHTRKPTGSQRSHGDANAGSNGTAQHPQVNFSGSSSPLEKPRPETTRRSVFLLLRVGPGAQRRPERGVEQTAILERVDVGDMGGVAEIGLPVPDQVAVALLADDR